MTTTGADVRPAASAPQRSIWRGMARSAGVRLLVLPVSALLGIVVTRLVIDEYGTDAFAQYGLLVGIGALLPFTDLGMSAAVMNAVGASDDAARDDRVRRVLTTALRVLLCSAAVLTALAALVTVLGLWPTLLGDGLLPGSGPEVAFCCFVLIALAMPLGVGQRLLAGLGRNHLSIAVLGLQTPLVLGALLLLMWLDVPIGPAVATLAFGATLLLSLACTLLAGRVLRPLLGQAVRAVPRVRSVPGARVGDVAWPTLVQMIALPIAMQTDRLVLSHHADSGALAEYNLASQMFTPIWALVSAAGVTLWPVFARARARGEDSSPVPMAWAFGGLGAAMGLVVALLSPFLAELASGGRIELPLPLVVSFAVLMTLQALKYPLGMYMTDAVGLRFQAAMLVAVLPLNVGLSWYLAGTLGAAGPVIGSAVGVGLSQVVANFLFVRHRRRVRA